ncbi:hypothetical protein CSB45_14765 [candidate division KSB3 bacterium]|uniref:RHS repeat-associated core domain-containing protein n=1 Tax=candidate division KSB3 bacterium TaxID=2044937 RepID=A0A2G6E1B0_9BACT|nr:MAG: hypothetical protein CSB45_14765 [candidate division KSB3 bacterium]PIE31085.1 MAG: hypothetical protein CSA57_00280 [candidate division KSB3 bacterium]
MTTAKCWPKAAATPSCIAGSNTIQSWKTTTCARYYQPGLGRFLTTDPVEGFPTEPTSLHRYLYGNDNPVSFIDPSGEFSLLETVTVGTAHPSHCF